MCRIVASHKWCNLQPNSHYNLDPLAVKTPCRHLGGSRKDTLSSYTYGKDRESIGC